MDTQLWMVRTTFFKWVVDGDEGSGAFKETSFKMMNIQKLKEKLSVHCDYSGGLVFV
jgi:hypothetical protein